MFESLVLYISDVFGVSDDHTRVVLLLLMGYPLALVLRYVLHPSRTSVTVRHLFSTVSGLTVFTLCYGWQVFIVLGGVAVGYVILITAPAKVVQRWSMGWIFVYMSAGHLHRTLTDYGGWHLDVTGPMMMLVQKLSLVGFAVHDGMGGNSRPLNEDQERQKLTSVPTVLEYMSYCFNFHSVLAGPSVTMREYLDFMDGSNFQTTESAKEPSCLYPVLTKLGVALCFCGVYVLWMDHKSPLPIDPSWNVLVKMAYFLLVTFVVRSRFYFVFVLNDSISNTAGLGFEGYDKQNNPKWELASNVDAVQMEFAMNLRNAINSWNLSSARWLRRVCYERVSWNPTLASFALSSWWHGFYPGYYMGLLSFGVSLMAAKKMRRLCNPFFTSQGAVLRWSYHLFTWLLTQLYVSYCSLPVSLLWISDTLTFWSYFYYLPTVAAVLVVLCVPQPGRPQRHKEQAQQDGKESTLKYTAAKSTKQD